MLIRFASAATVATILVSLSMLGLLLMGVPDPDGRFLIAAVWCVLPAIWGIWAVLAPAALSTEKLPFWGALLGLVAGAIVLYVLTVPEHLGFSELTSTARLVILPLVASAYYFFWTLVRRMIGALEGAPVD